ncbi:MAG: antitermination protein [Enterobacteriaceae bacterium]|jgi:DnaJ-class molecular chaperone|nr:antitermination protein [Enterobacteriaceae bacterium]
MNLENAVKFFAPKSPSLSDSSRATATESLSCTDVMASFGMCQSQAEFGMSAYLGKIGISRLDKQKALDLLTQYGMKHYDKYPSIRRLSPVVKVKIMKILATFAYADYCRSAAGVEECRCCAGKGLLNVSRIVIKSHNKNKREVLERDKKLCVKCNGKGVISVACTDCRGRGLAVDKVESEKQGVPVIRNCNRCNGVGYIRLPSTNAFRACKALSSEITIDIWKRSIKRLYEQMIRECELQESFADDILKKVTK